ncbi:hypothetical protein AKJ64_03585 [candidate division MSBL1 archaeon SCGC-AAA259E17]|uniref:3-phosphoshikimate 1-carboxyvinyltransferase n=1 Tax=candidate division MSBL1 archaeon SCGC-AAA259E17 TaxID=1698263 RepID=A0A133UDJ1_9EURY|nr:hypothetical protein AKJ64_03585 [candidate division MSBL1 archaeon SCGC-AAA259E17]
MDLEIEPTQEITGKTRPSPSKFTTQFATAVALLAEGKSVLNTPLLADDTRSLIKAIDGMGATTKRSKKRWSIWGTGNPPHPTGQVADSKKSIVGLSLLTSLSALASRVMVVTGKSQVRSIPVPSLLRVLQELGVDAHSTKSDDTPPLVVFESEIEGGKIALPDDTDPRFLPAFLLITPLTEEGTELKLRPKFKTGTTHEAVEVMRKGGIDVSITERRLKVTPGQYEPLEITPPLDAFSTLPYALGAILTGSELRISKVSKSENVEKFTSLLEKMGVELKKTSRSVWIKPDQEITSRRYSLEEHPEVLPFAAVLACAAQGTTRIINIQKARHMKSDQISAMVKGLRKMGAQIKDEGDEVVLDGPADLKGAEVDGREDDAVVAALAVAGFAADGKTIVKNRAETLRESYPRFVSNFQSLGGNISYRS